MNPAEKAKLTFAAFMVLVYLGLAAMLVFSNYYEHILFSTRRTIFAGVLATYGVFKAFTLYKNYSRIQNEEK